MRCSFLHGLERLDGGAGLSCGESTHGGPIQMVFLLFTRDGVHWLAELQSEVAAYILLAGREFKFVIPVF